MKTLRSGDCAAIDARANNVARLFYYEEFQSQLDRDLDLFLNSRAALQHKLITKLGNDGLSAVIAAAEKNDNSELLRLISEKGLDLKEFLDVISPDSKNVAKRYSAFDGMRFLFAMAKAQAYADGKAGNFHKNFREWLLSNGDFDINDCIEDFLEEVRLGFFRCGKSRQSG